MTKNGKTPRVRSGHNRDSTCGASDRNMTDGCTLYLRSGKYVSTHKKTRSDKIRPFLL